MLNHRIRCIYFQLNNDFKFSFFTWMIFFLITHLVLSALILLQRTALSFSATSQTKSFSWELFLNLFFHNSQRWAKERFSWLAMPKLKANFKISWYLERLDSKLGGGGLLAAVYCISFTIIWACMEAPAS